MAWQATLSIPPADQIYKSNALSLGEQHWPHNILRNTAGSGQVRASQSTVLRGSNTC